MQPCSKLILLIQHFKLTQQLIELYVKNFQQLLYLKASGYNTIELSQTCVFSALLKQLLRHMNANF